MRRAIIYIQLQHDLPRCFWSSLKKVRELWDGAIYLIAPQREQHYPLIESRGAVTFIPEESFTDPILNEYEKLTFFNDIHVGWDGFWDNTCKRFFYLYLLQKQNNIDEVLHIETDVVPYLDIAKIFDALGKAYKDKLVFSRHAPHQVSCCTMYCGAVGILELFCQEILKYFSLGPEHFYDLHPSQTILNETHFAHKFVKDQIGNHTVDTFPTTPEDDWKKLGFLIDPTAWGMWIDGLHRNPHIQSAVEKNYIGNEILAGKYDVHFAFKNGRIKMPYVYDKINKTSTPLATLHFNSKRPEKWI